MTQAIPVIHGSVARVIDVPSQSVTYLRIEVPIEYHSKMTEMFYGRRVLVMLAGDTMNDQPFGPVTVAAPPAPPEPEPEPKAHGMRISEVTKAYPKGGKLCAQAAQICDSRDFIEYSHLMHKIANPNDDVPEDLWGTTDAAIWLRKACGIQTRAQLDHELWAERRFHEVMAAFNHWRNASRET